MDLSNLDITGSLKLDISRFGSSIERELRDYIKPAPDGIYLNYRVNPVIQGGGVYYSGANKQNLLTDISNVQGPVFNHNFNLIIPAHVMQNKEKYLSNRPFISYRGIKLAEQFARDHLLGMLRYMEHYHKKLPNSIHENLNIPEHCYEDVESRIELCCLDLGRCIESFIGRDDYHIYTCDLKDKDFTINKHIDYRIYEWHRQREEANESRKQIAEGF